MIHPETPKRISIKYSRGRYSELADTGLFWLQPNNSRIKSSSRDAVLTRSTPADRILHSDNMQYPTVVIELVTSLWGPLNFANFFDYVSEFRRLKGGPDLRKG